MYTPAEVCEIFKISYKTVIRWIKANRIEAVKIGGQWRFSEEEVERIKTQGVNICPEPKLTFLKQSYRSNRKEGRRPWLKDEK